jgi:pimeloyl-ACP methyl ester carboxylesterase
MARPLFALILAALLAACAGPQAAAPTAAPTSAPTAVPSATPAPPTATPAPTAPPTPAATATPPLPTVLEAGALIDIGGGRALFLQCTQPVAGAPAVILEAGLAADHTAWSQVQPAAAQYARVCSYDRAGLGRSSPGPAPRDAERAAADLRALLDAAGVAGPYILVGHSFGGLFARRFAADNAAAVAGVVLVDAVHEDWWQQAREALPPEAPGDSERLKSFRRFLTAEVADPARNAEGIAIPAVAEQVREAGSLGATPLVVLVAGVADVLAPGLPPEVEAKLVGLLQSELPGRLGALSSDSTTVVVPDSGHNIPQQRPDIVVLAIQAVLAAAERKP